MSLKSLRKLFKKAKGITVGPIESYDGSKYFCVYVNPLNKFQEVHDIVAARFSPKGINGINSSRVMAGVIGSLVSKYQISVPLNKKPEHHGDIMLRIMDIDFVVQTGTVGNGLTIYIED